MSEEAGAGVVAMSPVEAGEGSEEWAPAPAAATVGGREDVIASGE
jgi:hypothetical protein